MLERLFGRKTKPVMETLLRFQVGDVEVIVEKEADVVRIRVLDLKTGTEAHRREVKL